MAGNDTSLKDTLKSVLNDTKDTSKADSIDTTDTSKSQADDTKSGGTSVEISGIKVDLSDIPEQDRPRIKKSLEEKLSLGDKGIRQKLTELNESKKKVETLERAMEELVNLGYTPELALDVLKKLKTTGTDTKNIRGFDKKIKEIESMTGISMEERQQAIKNLQEAKELLKEETGMDELSKKIDLIERNLGILLGSHTENRKSQLETQMGELSKEYGKDLVEKYHDVIMDEAIKFNVSPQKVLFFRADPKEIEQSLLAKSKKGDKSDKVNAISSSGSGITSASERIDIKKPWKGFLKELIETNK